MTDYRKKLIEVALPLEALNRESARENYIYRGNPSAVHKWWAQRPLAACRAVLFASLVDDPSAHPQDFPTAADQERERDRLFGLLERLVVWENSSDQDLFRQARSEITRWGDVPPAVFDPFCGGGTIPLEAQRLGLHGVGSDLNPVSVALTRALVDLPARFCDLPPVGGLDRRIDTPRMWSGSQGLANDIAFYGTWMREEAIRQIAHLYPAVLIGQSRVPAIAWLWARTVRCANPACGLVLPLCRSFTLSTRRGNETQAVPHWTADDDRVHFTVEPGKSTRQGTVARSGAVCPRCGGITPLDHVASEGMAGRMGLQLMAVVGQSGRRVYVAPSDDQLFAAEQARPASPPDTDLPDQALGFRVQRYGIRKHRDLFTPRQLVALETLSDLVMQARARAIEDGATDEYADAIATYLAFAVDKVVMYNSTLVPWYPKEDRQKSAFATQTVSMVWDFAEGNVLGEVGGSFASAVRTVAEAVEQLPRMEAPGQVFQRDAAGIPPLDVAVVSTDPPYYDNVPYADLSDVFYVWLRRTLREVDPVLFSTLLTPKAPELIAEPARFDGNKAAANRAFEEGMADVFARIRSVAHPDYPLTVYYAFKQTEADVGGSGVASTGWETMLSGLLGAGFAVTGTWPLRTERAGRMRDNASNALASSVVLVCRPRSEAATLATRKEFLGALRVELPEALKTLQHGNIAPVDLAQASIGPGMAVFSRYTRVVEADGSQMSVRAALALINQALDETLSEQEGELDSDTRWAIAWFDQFGLETGDFGDAETLSRAKGTSVDGMVQAGILEARAGKVRLLGRDELDETWTPLTDKRLTAWESTQHLIRRLNDGEASAATLARELGSYGEIARDLAYRLYLTCERRKWSLEGQAYNGLVVAWPQIKRMAASEGAATNEPQTTFEM